MDGAANCINYRIYSFLRILAGFTKAAFNPRKPTVIMVIRITAII